ncbi:MAG: VWA domain-containing protein [Planctomycetaceae bacterium]|nr:VWA domain-containing protein [Planctomycetaceae bacterium]
MSQGYSQRSAKPNRQQLVVVIADNSFSMRGEKASAAAQGVVNMILECQIAGGEQSNFRVLLISFATEAVIHPECRRTPVLEIDTDRIGLYGDGGQTNMPAAFRLARAQISEYLGEIDEHPQKSKHPLPLVIFFSDGHNNPKFGDPIPEANALKALTYDSLPILIVTAGVAVDEDDAPDEDLLKAIATTTDEGYPLYVPIQRADLLSLFLANTGSSAASTAGELHQVIRRLEHQVTRRLGH